MPRRTIDDKKAGVALLEFALVLPFFLVLVFAVIELTRYIQAQQKATLTAYNMADLLTQNLSLTERDVDTLLSAGETLMRPFPATELQITATSILQEAGDQPRIVWQRGWPSDIRSNIGVNPGTIVSLPNFVFLDRDQVVAVEVFYTHRSLFGFSYGDFLFPSGGADDSIAPDSLEFYKYAFTRPRYGSLLEMN